MKSQNIFEGENLVINGNIYSSDWLLYKENSCVLQLVSTVSIVW
jgi:hypothetical protein